ncbi:MAG: PQQ-dependent sugar dehydrogenase [Solirubrobacterales bacterium]
MPSRAGLALLAGLAALVLAAPATRAANLPAGFQDEKVLENLYEPSTFRFAGDGRIFVAERPGKILVFDGPGDSTPTVFADLRTKVFDRHDRGLLGLALDPGFEEGRPYVYALYTYDHILGDPAPPPKWGEPDHTGDGCAEPDGADDCLVSGRLVRLTANGDVALGGAGNATETVLAEGWCQQFSSHSIGDLEFGPEGNLYVSGGEGASFESADYGQFGTKVPNPCGDPPAGKGGDEEWPDAEGGALRALNPKLLSGKVLRIDPETGEGVAGNPRFGSADATERKILAEGFRNPFRFAIDPATDEVYVGNVGWGEVEEIDRFAGSPGSVYNSGWPCMEGAGRNPGYDFGLTFCEGIYATPGATASPFFSYRHDAGVVPGDPCNRFDGSAIAGLDFYEGSKFPKAYKGALFFSDPVRRCIYVMFAKEGRPDPSTTVPFLVNGGVYPGIDVQEGPEGNLFYAKLDDEASNGSGGSINRIAYFSGNQPPIARLSVNKEWSAGDLTSTFDASASSDADGETLSYAWDPENDGSFEAPSATATKTLTFKDEKNHTVAVRVSDQQGATSVARVTVYPHDTPPVPTILTPDPDALRWHVGQAIQFSGSAEDNGAPLPATSLDWTTKLFHCPFSGCHQHPLQAYPAVDAGTLLAPAHELPSHIELILTATDSRGLTASKSIDLDPSEVTLRIESFPPGLTVTAGPVTKQTPFELPTIEGSTLTLGAPAAASLGGIGYSFLAWSDKGARVHSVEAIGDATYNAEYKADPVEEQGGGGETGNGGGGNGGGGSSGQGPGPVIAPPPVSKRIAVRIDRHPSMLTRKRTAVFSFSSDVRGAGFRCQLDSQPTAPCPSPRSYQRLRPGPHRFRVVAVAPGDVSESRPRSFSWTVLCPRSQRLVAGRCAAAAGRGRSG